MDHGSARRCWVSSQLAANLEPQVRRMLKDKKAQALVENFALQWLQLQRLQTLMPDPQLDSRQLHNVVAFLETLR